MQESQVTLGKGGPGGFSHFLGPRLWSKYPMMLCCEGWPGTFHLQDSLPLHPRSFLIRYEGASHKRLCR